MLVALHALVLFGRHIFEPAAVPVDIDDSVHTCIERPVNYLSNALHQVLVDGVCAVVLHEVRPCNGYPEHAEAFVGIALYHLLGYFGASP